MSAPQGERSSPAAQAPPGSASIDMSGNLMHGPEGRTSRLTLISVLLGAMLGALTAVAMFGWILSLSDFRAWVVWGAGVAAMGLFNLFSFRIVRRVPTPWWRFALFIGSTLAAAYVGSNLYGLLPGWVAPPIPPVLWVGVVIAAVVVNLVMWTVYLHAYAARLARLAQ